GRRGEPARHHPIGLLDLADAVDAGVLHVGLDGQGAHASRRRRNSDAAAAGPVRSQGPQITKAGTAMIINSRFFNRSELIGFVALALVLFVILPLSLDACRLHLVAYTLTLACGAI